MTAAHNAEHRHLDSLIGQVMGGANNPGDAFGDKHAHGDDGNKGQNPRCFWQQTYFLHQLPVERQPEHPSAIFLSPQGLYGVADGYRPRRHLHVMVLC